MSDQPEHDGAAQRPSGPDLAAGVPSDQVPAGGVLAGHVNGEAVLLSRVSGRCHAIGASCTHYGAPLAEGLVVGDAIRCPWHHAAFDLRTGRMERPPALNDLPCWNVEERDGRVWVTGSARATPSRTGRGRTKQPDSVLIVGAGAAGTVAAETLRREGFAGRLVMVDADPDAPVDRPNLSKDYLAGNAPEEWIPLRPPEWFAERGIEHRASRRVVALDARERRVQLDDGQALTYDALLLATGASPVPLPVPVSGRPVYYLRSLADSRAIIRAAEAAGAGARAVVIGASFIGLEVAASLRARGLDVHVVAPESRPLERVMGAALGDFIRALHEEHGVIFHLERRPTQVTADGVVLDNGERLAASLVVAGIGVRPNVDLAERAGLGVGQGLVVNEYLETDAKGIFAAGDIARWPDARTGERIRVEHWVVAERQGQAAAWNILGAAEPFSAVPFFWSAHYDVMIRYVGHAMRWDAVEIDGSLRQRDCAVRFRANGRTLAMAAIGRDREALEEELSLERESAPAGSTR
jgi:3-phenylpropionate/trans-cinnamate dioxygenase ferredoxin reductase subunit